MLSCTIAYKWVQLDSNAYKFSNTATGCISEIILFNPLSWSTTLRYHFEVPQTVCLRLIELWWRLKLVVSKNCVYYCVYYKKVLQKGTTKRYYKKLLQKGTHLRNHQDLSFLMVFSKNILFILRSVRCWWRLYVFRTEKSHLTWFDLMLYWYKLHHDNHICYKLQVVIMYSLQIRLQKWPKGPCSKREATHRAGAPTWYLWNVVQMLYKMLYTVCHCCL